MTDKDRRVLGRAAYLISDADYSDRVLHAIWGGTNYSNNGLDARELFNRYYSWACQPHGVLWPEETEERLAKSLSLLLFAETGDL